jgi:hypothetical protein
MAFAESTRMHEAEDGKSNWVIVTIPDLFQSFLAEPPRLNPNYQKVKVEAEQWICQ